ncbi:MAG: hypothetical protein J6W56_09225 [Prevotella sp.]|nr:hypothetical protein [Prevotella sp.]
MTDYEYILKQARKFHYSKWTDEELRKCVDMLVGLSRQELVSLYTSKWTKDEKVLKEEIFKILYVDKLGKREERIKNLSTNELIEEFKDRQSGNIALIRQEMKYRYKENVGDDRAVITQAFINSSKGDQNWIELQERKELFGNSKK